MKLDFSLPTSFRRLAAVTAICGFGLSDSPAILGLFDEDRSKVVPNSEQLAEQERLAAGLFAKAQSEEAANNFSKARGIYQDIVKEYPRTNAASEAQFKAAELYQTEGKMKKAFEAYQEFLTNYKGSSRFSVAVERQFAIAENLRTTGKKGFLGGIGATIQPSRLLEMYQLISVNSPKTDLAAKSAMSIGAIQADQGDLAGAIAAYKSVVENYPNTNFSGEAQYKLVQLYGKEAERSNSPVDMRQQKEAGIDFLALNRNDPRATDVKESLGQLESLESEKAFNVGRFYERRKEPQSAAVYYREVLKSPGSKHYEDARKRLNKLIEKDPSLASIVQKREGAAPATAAAPSPSSVPDPAPSSIELPTRSGSGGVAAGSPSPAPYTPPASAPDKPRLTDRADYVGPPPPNLETAKPKMRTSQDDVVPIPPETAPPAGN